MNSEEQKEKFYYNQLAIFSVVQIADMISTLASLYIGGQEMGTASANLIAQYGILAFGLVKLGIATLGPMALEVANINFSSDFDHRMVGNILKGSSLILSIGPIINGIQLLTP